MKDKKIKIELTLYELKLLINCIGYWEYEYQQLSHDEMELLEKLTKIEGENEN